MPDEYQCSFCTHNRYNGDSSCPLPLDDRTPDILKGMNLVIKNCGCGSFNDVRISNTDHKKKNIPEDVQEEIRVWLKQSLQGIPLVLLFGGMPHLKKYIETLEKGARK